MDYADRVSIYKYYYKYLEMTKLGFAYVIVIS